MNLQVHVISAHLIGASELKLPAISCPRDVLLAVAVIQKLKEELPKLDRPVALVACQHRGRNHGLTIGSHTLIKERKIKNDYSVNMSIKGINGVMN